MDIKPSMIEMESGVLNQESAECFNHIPIKHEAEAENKAQLQNCTSTFLTDELKATVPVDNCTEATVTHLVKTELVEFYNDSTASLEISYQKDTLTVLSETMMKTETNIEGFDVDLSYTCEEGDDDDLHNNSDRKSDSNSDSDPKLDPFADVCCDPSFSNTPQGQDSSPSVTNSGLINSLKTDANQSLILPSFAKRKLSNARILKHNFRRKTSYLYPTFQCQLCFVTQGSEIELKIHLETCATSHRHCNRFCVLCNKLFSSPNVNKSHAVQVHGISFSLQCQLCLEELNLESELNTHLKICAPSHPNYNRFCALCNKLVSTACVSKKHALQVHGISVCLQCKLCLEVLHSESELKTHLKICAPSHPYSNRFCVPCNKLLCNVNSLQNHAFSIHGIARTKRRKLKRR